MYKGIFDSHAHYDDERFNEDREELLARLQAEGLAGVVSIGASLSTSRAAVELAQRYSFVYAAVGVHPIDADNLPDDYIEQLRELAAQPKVCAIGEIGLDYHYNSENKARQREVFVRQLELAQQLSLPVVIHDRDAHRDTLEILREYKPKGVVHCFSGSEEMAQEVIRLGMYVGFTGVVTFKNARRALEAAQSIPLDRLLIETDCPYLAPEPHRGHRCDSSMLDRVVDKLAPLHGVTPEQFVEKTARNAAALFGF